MPVSAQDASTPRWWVTGFLGVIDLELDERPPGVTWTLAIERRFSRRFAVHVEGGSAVIEESRGTGTGWPMLGAGARAWIVRGGPLGSDVYVLGKWGVQSSDWTAAPDVGFGVAFLTTAGLEVGAEYRRRLAEDRRSGNVSLFRIGIPHGRAGSGDSGR